MSAPTVPVPYQVTEAEVLEKQKLQKHFGKFDILFFLVCTLVGLDTIGTVAHNGPQAFIWLLVLAVVFFSTRPKFLLPLATALNLSSVRFLSPSLSFIIVAGGVAVGCIAGLVASRRV